MEPGAVQPVIDGASVRYGVLGAVCALLIFFLWTLWRHALKRDDQIAAERKATAEADKDRAVRDVVREKEWEARLIEVKREYAEKARELSDELARELSEQVRLGRENEAAIHTRFSATIKDMEQAAREAQNKTATMLEKLTDRLLPQDPPSPRGRGEYGPRGGGG